MLVESRSSSDELKSLARGREKWSLATLRCATSPRCCDCGLDAEPRARPAPSPSLHSQLQRSCADHRRRSVIKRLVVRAGRFQRKLFPADGDGPHVLEVDETVDDARRLFAHSSCTWKRFLFLSLYFRCDVGQTIAVALHRTWLDTTVRGLLVHTACRHDSPVVMGN